MIVNAHFVKSKKESEAFPLSVSKAKTFDNCAAKYYYQYIKKLPRKTWSFHILGTFAHEVLENFHKKLLEDKNQDIFKLMTEVFQQSLKGDSGKKILKEDKDLVWQIMGKYLAQINKFGLPNIIDIEKEFFVEIDKKVLVNGYIDLIKIDDDGVLHVADYKTTKDKKYLKDYFQLLTYAFVIMLEKPELKKVRASYIMLRDDFAHLTKEYSRDNVLEVQEQFFKYVDSIKAEKLWRPNPQFLCKYCDYLDHCADGKNYLIKRKLMVDTSFGKESW